MKEVSGKELFKDQNWLKSAFPFLLLTALGFAVFNPVIHLPPVDFDDLILISAVKNTTNPLSFLMGDWGFGNNAYRPLHSISLWVGYQVFGVSSGPNQLLNIILHIGNILLLYALLARASVGWKTAFLIASLSLFSMYTTSPAVWVSDRPTLLVAFFLLILLHHLFGLKDKQIPNLIIVVAISILGLMSKESSLVIPLVALFSVFRCGASKQKKFLSMGILASVLLGYGLFRVSVFGNQAAYYDESGYLFGTQYYDNFQMLSSGQKLIAVIENSFKNIIAVFLPLFDSLGKISPLGTISNTAITIAATVSITLASMRKKISPLQVLAIVVIGVNAIIHYQVFRYRALYLSQIAFSLLIGLSFMRTKTSSFRKTLVLVVSSLFLLWNIWVIGENLSFAFIRKQKVIQDPNFVSTMLATSNSMDQQVLEEVARKYRH